jgi:hypothetical protein
LDVQEQWPFPKGKHSRSNLFIMRLAPISLSFL